MSFTLCPRCGQRNDSSGHICWAYHPHVTATSEGTNPISSMTIVTDNTAVIRALEQRVAELEAENARLRDPNWAAYVELTRKWLEKYPPDIFTGVSGDSGPLFVIAVRNALIELGDRE